MRHHKGSRLVVGGLIVLLAGCNNGGSTTVAPSESASPTDSASATADSGTGTDSGSTPATVVVPTTVTQAPATVTQAPVTTTVTQPPGRNGNRGENNNGHNGNSNANGNGHGNGNNGGLRAMTTTERQMYQRCEHQASQSGCNEYTGDALRNRGINPNS